MDERKKSLQIGGIRAQSPLVQIKHHEKYPYFVSQTGKAGYIRLKNI